MGHEKKCPGEGEKVSREDATGVPSRRKGEWLPFISPYQFALIGAILHGSSNPPAPVNSVSTPWRPLARKSEDWSQQDV